MAENLEKREKAEILAQQLELMKLGMYQMDLDFMKQCVKDMQQHANYYDTLAAINPHWMGVKSDVMRAQALMLESLVQFIEQGKRIGILKEKIKGHIQFSEEIEKMFI